ncbi:MAG: hypothetical protein QOE99_505 [Actinomycetota bacterium]|jgi:hypothetical protein|nr:hypothetical protein [Actinomycetota bacterium]
MTRPSLSLVAVVGLLVAGVAGTGALPDRAPIRRTAATSAAVIGASAICPDLRQDRDVIRTRVSAGVAVAEKGVSGTGRLMAQPLSAKGAPALLPVDKPGQVAVDLGSTLSGDALEVTARGPLAAGLELEQITRGEGGSSRGLAGLRCEAPKTEAWFVGGATQVGDSTTLVMANPDDTPALVDVVVYTSDGPADVRPGRGISIPGRKRASLGLDQIAPDKQWLAVHVIVQRGRVAAAVRHARLEGRTPKGVEWVPQAQPPATTVVVPGLPQGPGRRILSVTNPGLDPTIVSLQLTTADGQFIPTGMDALEVPPGTTLATELVPLTDKTPATVKVVSDGGPVVAGAFVYDLQEGPVREISYAGSALPLSGPSLLTDLVINRPTESTLILTALDQAATVDVTPVAIVGIEGPVPAAKQVTVPAHRTTTLKMSTFLPPGATGRLAVEVRPTAGSAPVYAARYLREHGSRGPLTTILDLQGAAQRVPLPAVVRDPLVGVSR